MGLKGCLLAQPLQQHPTSYVQLILKSNVKRPERILVKTISLSLTYVGCYAVQSQWLSSRSNLALPPLRCCFSYKSRYSCVHHFTLAFKELLSALRWSSRFTWCQDSCTVHNPSLKDGSRCGRDLATAPYRRFQISCLFNYLIRAYSVSPARLPANWASQSYTKPVYSRNIPSPIFERPRP